MNKRKLVLISAPILLIIFSILYILLPPKQESKVCINQNCFNIEIAKTNSQREKGLMYRLSLDQNKGTLFIFPSSNIYSFWMKNTLIPLDIIWIAENKTIVHIHEDATPCNETCLSIVPPSPSLYVLEINAGLTKALNLSIGDFVDLEI